MFNTFNLRSKDQEELEVEGSGVRLLSLDGGGIKVLSEIEILDQITWTFSTEPQQGQIKPCEMFDLIGGSGTGGLLAILLHPLNRTLEEARADYIKIMTSVFSPSPSTSHMTREQILEKEIQDLCKVVLNDRDAPLRCSENCGGNIKCRTFVLTSPTHNHSHPRLLTTYPTSTTTTGVGGGSGEITIWQAVRATMAYPNILDDIIICEEGEVFGVPIRTNNPVCEVLEQAKSIWGGSVGENAEENRKWASVLVSIGSGMNLVVGLPREEQESLITQALIAIARDCGPAHQAMEAEFIDNDGLNIPYIPSQQPNRGRARRRILGAEGPIQEQFYYRFNVEQGLQDFKEFEFERSSSGSVSRPSSSRINTGTEHKQQQQHMGRMMTHTAQYLCGHVQKNRMDQVVDALRRRKKVYKIPRC